MQTDKPGLTVLPNIVSIGDSIWFSSSHKSHFDQSENGMSQYCSKTHKIINTFPYSEGIVPCRHVCCKYKNKIYLIDGEHGQIILFDPELKTYSSKLEIPKIGMYPSAVVVFDKIHFFHGERNVKYHFVYDPNKNTLNTYTDKAGGMYVVSAFVYQNKIIKFGGWNINEGARSSTVMISQEIKQDLSTDMEWTWTEKTKWKLPFGNHLCGYILYKHYVIIFGGSTNPQSFEDSIYLLNLESDDGWKELKHIKCPIKAEYMAVLSDNHVHLFLGSNQWPNWRDGERGHYTLPISTILGSEFLK